MIHLLFSTAGIMGPAASGGQFLGVSWWGMAVRALMAIFTTSGTFMLLFVAALQGLGSEFQEAALVDGASGWQRFRLVTLPMLKPTLFTVLTLGMIGCWQVFDQIYVGTQGGPLQDDAPDTA